MKLEFKTKEDLMAFFAKHTDFHHVHRISELLVSHQNIQEEEIKRIRQILHELKSGDYVIVQNEGANIYEEKFSSTPDRVSRFLNELSKTKNYYNNKNTDKDDEVKFIYSSNNGLYLIGKDDYLFGIEFSTASTECIHVYNDHKTIDSIAIVDGIINFEDFNFERKYDGTSRSRSPKIGEIVLLKNIHGKYALLKIENIKVKSRGDNADEVKFVYKILGDCQNNLIVSEAENETVHNKKDDVESVEKIQEILIRRATGIEAEPFDEDDYKQMRKCFLTNKDMGDCVPSFIRDCRDLSSFWAFIQPKFPTYKERRSFIYAEFSKLFDIIEDINTAQVSNNTSKINKESNQTVSSIFAGGDIKAGGDIIVGNKYISSKKKSGFDHKSEVMKILYWVGGTVLLLVVLLGIYKITGVNLNTFK